MARPGGHNEALEYRSSFQLCMKIWTIRAPNLTDPCVGIQPGQQFTQHIVQNLKYTTCYRQSQRSTEIQIKNFFSLTGEISMMVAERNGSKYGQVETPPK